MYRGTFARVRGLVGLTSSPVQIGSWSECPRCCPAVPGDSGPGLRALGSTSISGFLRPVPESPRFQPSSQATLDRARCRGAEQLFRELALGPRVPGVDQWSWATLVQVGGPTVSTSSPGVLVHGSEGPQGRPDVFGDSGPVPSARWVHQVSKATRGLDRGPFGQPDVPGDSGPAPRACGWTSSPGPLALASKGPRGRPAVPGDWGPGPKALGVDQLSRATQARIRGCLWWTSCPGTLRLVSSGSGVDQLSRATWDLV